MDNGYVIETKAANSKLSLQDLVAHDSSPANVRMDPYWYDQ